MASKDPAALFYIDKWLVATAEMDADLRGWYLNLILHQYDKKSLPNNIEVLAVLANVKFSEFERFKQMFEQVLRHKFKENESGRLKQEFATEVIQAREKFTEKRELAGKIGYFIKFVKRVHGDDYKFLEYLKNEIDFENLDTKDEENLKQVLKQMLKLYINTNKDIDNDALITIKQENEMLVKTASPYAKKIIPSLDEVIEYIVFEKLASQNEAEKFFDYYQANGWRVGKNTMKDWKAAARNWLKNASNFNKSNNNQQSRLEKFENSPSRLDKFLGHE